MGFKIPNFQSLLLHDQQWWGGMAPIFTHSITTANLQLLDWKAPLFSHLNGIAAWPAVIGFKTPIVIHTKWYCCLTSIDGIQQPKLSLILNDNATPATVMMGLKSHKFHSFYYCCKTSSDGVEMPQFLLILNGTVAWPQLMRSKSLNFNSFY